MPLSPAVLAKLDEIVRRRDELRAKAALPELIADGPRYQLLLRELGAQEKLASRVEEYRGILRSRKEASAIVGEAKDPDLIALAREELAAIEVRERIAEEALLEVLIRDEDEDRERVIMEVRAGTGGDEATLFAADLFKMYAKYAESRGWKVELLDSSLSEVNGFKEVSFAVSGKEVFRRLRYESGGHRVQRVPATETQGRIHTSAATVAVLPEVEEIELAIRPEDLEIQAMRAGGPGGQNVNKVESAIRITHRPTGMVVVCREQRSQQQNRVRAMAMLRSHLYERLRRKAAEERASERKQQIGSGDRNERIRTYNFPQNRVTDHRLNENFNLETVVAGKLDPLIAKLLAQDRELRLKAL